MERFADDALDVAKQVLALTLVENPQIGRRGRVPSWCRSRSVGFGSLGVSVSGRGGSEGVRHGSARWGEEDVHG